MQGLPLLLVLLGTLCASVSATLTMRVTVECPRDRNIIGMSENAKVWDSFDDQLMTALVDDCQAEFPEAFDLTTLTAESPTTFTFDVNSAKVSKE